MGPLPGAAVAEVHAKVSGSPSASLEADPSNAIAAPWVPEYGPPTLATGGRLAMVTVAEAGADVSIPSLTTSVTVKVPRVAYAWVGAGPVPVLPSPKSHA